MITVARMTTMTTMTAMTSMRLMLVRAVPGSVMSVVLVLVLVLVLVASRRRRGVGRAGAVVAGVVIMRGHAAEHTPGGYVREGKALSPQRTAGG